MNHEKWMKTAYFPGEKFCVSSSMHFLGDYIDYSSRTEQTMVIVRGL